MLLSFFDTYFDGSDKEIAVETNKRRLNNSLAAVQIGRRCYSTAQEFFPQPICSVPPITKPKLSPDVLLQIKRNQSFLWFIFLHLFFFIADAFVPWFLLIIWPPSFAFLCVDRGVSQLERFLFHVLPKHPHSFHACNRWFVFQALNGHPLLLGYSARSEQHHLKRVGMTESRECALTQGLSEFWVWRAPFIEILDREIKCVHTHLTICRWIWCEWVVQYRSFDFDSFVIFDQN